jgi:hypothetical protein
MRRFIWATSYLAGGIAAGAISAYVLIQQAGVEPAGAGTSRRAGRRLRRVCRTG